MDTRVFGVKWEQHIAAYDFTTYLSGEASDRFFMISFGDNHGNIAFSRKELIALKAAIDSALLL
jgi:hypothetical protein